MVSFVLLQNILDPFILWDIGIEWANVEYIYSSDDCVVWKWRLFSTKWTKSVVSLIYDFCFLSIGCMSESMKLEMRSVGPPLPETFGRPAKFGLWIWVRVDFNVKVVSSLLISSRRNKLVGVICPGGKLGPKTHVKSCDVIQINPAKTKPSRAPFIQKPINH